MIKEICIVGAGYMAQQYAKVLSAQNKAYIVVGRGNKSAETFEIATGIRVVRGGIEVFLRDNQPPKSAIVAVCPSLLSEVTKELITAGVKNILVEKPGCRTLWIKCLYSI